MSGPSVKILSYLSTRDRIVIRYVSRKFQDVGEVPLLWKEVCPDYDPRHMIGVINVLKACGEHELSRPRETNLDIGNGILLYKSNTSKFT